MISEECTYLPQSPADEARGLFVSTAGSASIPSNSPYPPCHHPKDYLFAWKHGRVLPVYALVYITRGEGHFESRISGSLDVKAGDIMVLY